MVLLASIGFWVAFALFGTAFECGGVVHWGADCSAAGGGIKFAIIATNFITDAMLAVWMVPTMWGLQARFKDRILPILLMGSRVLVCMLQIAEIGVLARLHAEEPYPDPDSTWNNVNLWTISV
jgi:hypothetical protein